MMHQHGLRGYGGDLVRDGLSRWPASIKTLKEPSVRTVHVAKRPEQEILGIRGVPGDFDGQAV
jgi:hypothetical protein